MGATGRCCSMSLSQGSQGGNFGVLPFFGCIVSKSLSEFPFTFFGGMIHENEVCCDVSRRAAPAVRLVLERRDAEVDTKNGKEFKPSSSSGKVRLSP